MRSYWKRLRTFLNVATVVAMARPKGHRLSPTALEDILRLRGDSITAVADRSGIPRATLSGLAGGFHRASVPVAHQLAGALGCNPETLFPTMRPSFIESEQVA